jgi:hypothetical protein
VTISIIDAMNSKTLFAPWFKPGILRQRDSWGPWKTFLKALFGLPMTAEELETFRRFTGHRRAPTTQFTEAFIVAGRRAGKSRISAMIGAFLAGFRNYDGVLSPGEVGVVMLLAADKRQARILKNYVDAFFTEIPTLAALVESRTQESITLKNRVSVEVHTSGYRSVRGYTLVAVICDEISFWPASAESANPANETLIAVRPGLATIPNSLLLAISSPYSKRGPLYEAFRDHYGKDDAPVLVWRAPTQEMNPTINSLVIAAARLRDSVAARTEYDAEFRSDLETLFSVEAIERCIVSGRFELLRETGFDYVGFTDPSGGSSDSFTLAVAHNERGTAVLDCVREIHPPFSPAEACEEFSGVLKGYGISTVVGDKYAGAWPAEGFSRYGIQYRTSERTRSEIYLAFLPMVMSTRCELLDNKRLVNQFVGLERRVARSGKDSIDHSPNAHDDVCNSAAGALVKALGGAGELGLIEYFKNLASGVFKQPEEGKPTQSEDPFGARATLAFELKLQGLLKPLGAPEEVMSPCPRCQGTRIFVGGCGIRCSQCGAVYANQNDSEPVSVPGSDSPCCSSPLPQRIAGGGVRCGNCGRLSNIAAAPAGVSRDAAISGTWSGGRGKVNSGAFRQAFARLLFGGKK